MKIKILMVKIDCQDFLGREVDLLEEQAIKNPYLRKSVDSSKMLIYATTTDRTCLWRLLSW